MADLCYTLWCIILNDLFDLLITFGSLCDEFVILESLGNDHVHDTICKCNVGTWFQFQMDVCMFCKIDVTRVNNDQLAATLYCLTDLHTYNRMCFFRVGTYEHDHIWFLGNILDWVGHCTGTKCHCQTCYRCRVAYTCTVIGVVCSETGTDHLLNHVDILVR